MCRFEVFHVIWRGCGASTFCDMAGLRQTPRCNSPDWRAHYESYARSKIINIHAKCMDEGRFILTPPLPHLVVWRLLGSTRNTPNRTCTVYSKLLILPESPFEEEILPSPRITARLSKAIHFSYTSALHGSSCINISYTNGSVNN